MLGRERVCNCAPYYKGWGKDEWGALSAYERAREFAKSESIQVFSLQAILKALWKKKLKNKGEVKQILERIKTADNLAMSKEIERGIFVD